MITTSCRKALVILAGLIFVLKTSAQDTLAVRGLETRVDVLPYAKVIDTGEELDATAALLKTRRHGHRLQKATIGFTKNVYWAFFTIRNKSSLTIQQLLEVENPHIDCLRVFSVTKDTLLPNFETGDKFAFAERPVENRKFLFPVTLQGGEAKSFLIKIDKRNSSLNFPLYIWNERAHAKSDYVQNIGYGLYFGFILLCAVYSILTFIFLRQIIYLLYFFWVMTSGLFVFTSLGFSFQFLYPNVPDLNSSFRVYVEILGLITFIMFTQKFLNVKTHSPKVNRVLNYILIGMAILCVPLAFGSSFYMEHGSILLPFANIMMIVSLLLVLYVAFISYDMQKATIQFYFAAFASLIAGSILMILIEFGNIPAERFSFNPFMVGSAIELFIFSLGLTYGVKKIYDEKNALTVRIARQQKDLMKAYVDGVERERQRISQELHDDIGSRLSSLNRFVINEEAKHNDKLQQQIEILCEDVRNMSHQLAPPSLKIAGLKQKVLELTEQLERDAKLKVDVQFYDFPDTLPDEASQHVYRILQEAFNNIAKHADASLVDIQFFAHEDEYVITLEDNGKGFNTSSRDGIGLQNVRARVEALQGTLEISSQPGRGTQMMVHVPRM